MESLAPPLHDPHALEIKPGQLSKIKDASLLVRIGLDHEPWLDRALRTLSDRRFVRDSPNYLDTSKEFNSFRPRLQESGRIRERTSTASAILTTGLIRKIANLSLQQSWKLWHAWPLGSSAILRRIESDS